MWGSHFHFFLFILIASYSIADDFLGLFVKTPWLHCESIYFQFFLCSGCTWPSPHRVSSPPLLMWTYFVHTFLSTLTEILHTLRLSSSCNIHTYPCASANICVCVGVYVWYSETGIILHSNLYPNDSHCSWSTVRIDSLLLNYWLNESIKPMKQAYYFLYLYFSSTFALFLLIRVLRNVPLIVFVALHFI